MNRALSQRSTTPAIGQGSNALLKGCLIPVTLVGIVLSTACDTVLLQRSVVEVESSVT